MFFFFLHSTVFPGGLVVSTCPCHVSFLMPSQSSLCDVSACPLLCAQTGSGGDWHPTRSSVYRIYTQTGTEIHGSQGTGIQPTYKRKERSIWLLMR